jgi:hypothetical protein
VVAPIIASHIHSQSQSIEAADMPAGLGHMLGHVDFCEGGVYSDWEGFDNCPSKNSALSEDVSINDNASLPDMAYILGKVSTYLFTFFLLISVSCFCQLCP